MPASRTTSLCFATLVLTAELASAGNPRSAVSTPASQFFSGARSVRSYQTPSRPTAAPQQMDISQQGKPFANLYRRPALSPYLSLELFNEEDTGLPNYYAFYKPQRDQQEANELQEARIRRLQQQVRMANSTGALSRNPTPGMPTTGNSSQFLNLGGYYPGLR